ncbi:MAG: ABC transporter permease [Acidobacteriota bacterium]|nr:ABC transporter permease [Acidobacteriota bacterium]
MASYLENDDLALGIGANAVIFSLISGVLLRPLPFFHPDRLVQLNESDPTSGRTAVSFVDLQDWREHNSSFEAMVAYGNVGKDLQGIGEPERISAVWAEGGLFRMLGVNPVLGRTFREGDPLNEVVLSAGLWKGRFGGDPSCIGQKLILDGEPYTIIGVMPEEFQFPYRNSRTLLWLPWEVLPQYAQNRNYHVDFVVARLKDKVSANAAKNELDILSMRLEANYPQTNEVRRAVITSLSEVVTGHIRPALLTLFGAVGMVLLIACANVMNLLLARMAARRHEIAIRAALGAGRSRLIQQLLIESLLVSIAGGALGLIVALTSLPLVLNAASAHIPHSWEIGLDWRVFCFLGLVSVGVGIVFGLAPALSLSQLDVQNGLNDTQSSRSVGYGSSKLTGRRLRDGLVIAELTTAFILLTGASLLFKAFLHLQSTPTGLVTDRVLTLHMSIVLRDYSARGSYDRYLGELEESIAQVPGVRAVGFVQYLPLQNWGWTGGFSILGRPGRAVQRDPQAELRYVSTAYFRALEIPLRSGRLFNNRDTSDSRPVIVINEALARRYFHNENPIGQQTDRGTVIGIVGDVRQTGLGHPATPEIYYTFAQNTAATSDAGVAVVVSTLSRPEAFAPAVRNAIHRANPRQALFDIKTMDTIVAESISDVNLYRWLIEVFALLALTLALAGIYSVISYAVVARTREFAIRLALGADSGKLFRLVLRRGSVLVVFGLALGVAGAITLTRTLKSFVPSMNSFDLALFMAIGLFLATVALMACFAPARRASRVDPNVALRYE